MDTEKDVADAKWVAVAAGPTPSEGDTCNLGGQI